MCICRNGEGIEGYDVVQVVPELSTLIETIPDRITFEGTARADRNQTSLNWDTVTRCNRHIALRLR